jgi:hypothetical protein
MTISKNITISKTYSQTRNLINFRAIKELPGLEMKTNNLALGLKVQKEFIDI